MKLLLVEDKEPLRKVMAETLRNAGYSVDESGDGNEGLWFLRENRYAVIVLDLGLPSRDGMSLLSELRINDKDTSVLVVTARDSIDEKVEGLQGGADDYMVKPFALEELVARVQVLTRRSFGVRKSEITVGSLVVDTLKRTAMAGDHSLNFTAMEFSILELLAMRRQQVVSKADIWEQLYDFDSDCESNVVEVLIARLRKKMSEAHLPKLIHTKRGAGYILEATS
ncbi:MAG: DNA-binding response OmpR family regulator [Verrucomicrobiales bacterium]|jgi:DNA-binding response OmpR family regulator